MAAADQINEFPNERPGVGDSADRWVTLTPHNSNVLPFKPKGIHVGATAGTIVCVDEAGNESTFYGGAGAFLPIRPRIIKATGTTATPIIGLRR